MNTRSILLTSAVIALWGVWGCFGRAALLRGMPPISLFGVEIVASLVVAAVAFGVLSAERGELATSWNFYGVISGVALGLGLFFYYFLLQRGRASLVIPLTSTYPVVATLLAIVVLKERPSILTWFGMALVVIGVIVIVASVGSHHKNTPG